MPEADAGFHNVDHLLRPIEQGVVEKFDALFTAREKTLKHWLAGQLNNKQEFLTKTFPSLVTVGAEHPQLSGGVLYMFGLLTEHTPQGSEAVNSIARRFAEHKIIKSEQKTVGPILRAIHENKSVGGHETPVYLRPDQARMIRGELTRTGITRELYDFRQCPVDVTYSKDGRVVNLGRNSSEISILNKDSKTGRSMVFICASAGNPMGAESFAVEYALKTGDKVYIVGQPDGASGHMSREFANAAVSDAMPPKFDPFRKFRAPSYSPHTQFMKQAIQSVLPKGETFDLYSYSGGGILAKNLLHDPDISQRVKNAVFLNPAGVTTMHTLFPVLFRRLSFIGSLWQSIRDLPHIVRFTFERDRNEAKHTPAFWFRDRVTVAIQSGSHYRQPGWDSMKVNGGNIVMYVGGKDLETGGRQFARHMLKRLSDTENPPPSPVTLAYDRNANHITPFSHPENVLDRVMKKYYSGYMSSQTA